MMPEPRSCLLTSRSARVDKVRTELESPVHFFALGGSLEGWASFDDAVWPQPDTSLR
ncbi:MAG: hypothetical protein ACJAR2_003876 [Ilumatobacter sp.]|jgi:hypothetical protein